MLTGGKHVVEKQYTKLTWFYQKENASKCFAFINYHPLTPSTLKLRKVKVQALHQSATLGNFPGKFLVESENTTVLI
jgi:hypothetical protein